MLEKGIFKIILQIAINIFRLVLNIVALLKKIFEDIQCLMAHIVFLSLSFYPTSDIKFIIKFVFYGLPKMHLPRI